MSLRRVPIDELPKVLQSLVPAERIETKDTLFLEVLANAPHMASWYFDSFYDDIFFGGTVPVRIKELVRLRLSLLHGCAF